MIRTIPNWREARWLLAPPIAGVMLLAGCASTPPAPIAAIATAHQALVNAERVDSGHYAAGEIEEARSKLAQAQAEVGRRHMIVARRLALESKTEADLATAITAEKKARLANVELQRGNDALSSEMQRNSGSTP